MNKIKQIGDKVWFLEDNKIKEGVVNDVTYYVTYKKISSSTQQEDEYTCGRDIREVFDSKESLIESLSK